MSQNRSAGDGGLTGTHDGASRVLNLALQLTSWPSETGSEGEALFAEKLFSLLSQIPYFRDHPENLKLVASHGSPLTHSVLALVRGSGRSTLALTGHFDTVSTENFHKWKSLARDSLKLRDVMIEHLRAQPERTPQESQTLNDLLSGTFLPGRGMLDMKSGVAVAIDCIERFAANPPPEGNLLLVLTPDEERESRGMRSLRNALPALTRHFQIDVEGAVNLDVTSDYGDGNKGRAVYAGTIGKLLPFAMVIGCPSHASYPFEGVSAQLIASRIIARIEANPNLSDRDDIDLSPPPICLEAKDLRDGYEVTTPERVWIAFNWLYHSLTAKDLFERFSQEVGQAVEDAIDEMASRANHYARLTGRQSALGSPRARIIDFSTLKKMAAERQSDNFDRRLADKQEKVAKIDNPLLASRLLTDWMVGEAKVEGPSVVIGFSGLHYPPSRLKRGEKTDQRLIDAIDGARGQFADSVDEAVSWQPFFQGISDMSFLGVAADTGTVVADNTPIGRLIDQPPEDALAFPVVNLGPWGREFHQKFERVYAPYAFETLPRLVEEIARRFLSS
ncbi:M20/M25/M40 family metallo-hydrolase [Oryzifoliimicrobium ureilyticus]|uniref:M20/M25/M40 family metallo-hydrolase n=1 Tax=Oryzifoliimicrobium ureilyticus TaxID=3113724 RepID=UPI0030764C60